MKTFKIASKVVATWLVVALILDGVMIYSHFYNTELADAIIKQIDKVIY